MVFSSSVFLCAFLPLTIVLYYIIKNHTYRNTLLFAASLFFYAWGEPRNVLILISSIIINYLLALRIKSLKDKGRRGARGVLAAAIVINCAILFVYKYLDFAVDNINALLSLLGIRRTLPKSLLALPIGISFFTFQAMSYVIDIYRGTAPVQTNIINFGLFLSFFPQLIAGPIVRYNIIAGEINQRSTGFEDFSQGARRFIIGLGKKVLIANTVAVLADYAFESIESSLLGLMGAWFGAICYTLQIYFDFSGYSDMALGLGRMFGFHFPENFNFPYAASTVTDFWRRWHISLSSWFRDYVYIPLGGSRVTKGRLIFNLFVVWLLTGIWHGANWTFICWGLVYFILLSIEKLSDIGELVRKNRVVSILYRLFTLVVIIVCWVIFRADNITMAVRYISCMFVPRPEFAMIGARYFSLRYFGVVAFSAFLALPVLPLCWAKLKSHIPGAVSAAAEDVFCIAVLVLSLATTVSSTYNPFIYFNF